MDPWKAINTSICWPIMSLPNLLTKSVTPDSCDDPSKSIVNPPPQFHLFLSDPSNKSPVFIASLLFLIKRFLCIAYLHPLSHLIVICI